VSGAATDIAEALRTELRALRTELRGEIQAMRNELHGDIGRLDAKIDSRFDQLGSRIDSKLPSWWQMPLVIGSTVTLLAALYAAAQFLRLHGWWPG
jgi:hypothetical protein